MFQFDAFVFCVPNRFPLQFVAWFWLLLFMVVHATLCKLWELDVPHSCILSCWGVIFMDVFDFMTVCVACLLRRSNGVEDAQKHTDGD